MTHLSRRGFTLVEMLVVLVLLSLIMLAVVSALRSVAQGSDRADARFERLDDERITRDFLRGVLARVSARLAFVLVCPFGGTTRAVNPGRRRRARNAESPRSPTGIPRVFWDSGFHFAAPE